MEKELDLNLKIEIPEEKRTAGHAKLTLLIDKDLGAFYQSNNKGYVLTKVLRSGVEQILREVKARKEASLLSAKDDKTTPQLQP